MFTEDIAHEEHEDRMAEAMHDDPARERDYRAEIDAYLDAQEAEYALNSDTWEDADTGLTSTPYTRMVWGEEADRIDAALPY